MKNLLKFLPFLCLIYGSTDSRGQLSGQAKIDSLLKLIPKAIEDTNKVILLNVLANCYQNMNMEESIKYGKAGLELATKLSWKRGIAKADNALGLDYIYTSEYSEGIDYIKNAITNYADIADSADVGGMYINLGMGYQRQGNYPFALANLGKALVIFNKLQNKKGISFVLTASASIYESEANYALALDYHFKALKIAEESGEKHTIAKIKHNIGSVYLSQKDYPNALEYGLSSLKLYEETDDKQGTADVSTNIGLVYLALKDYHKVLLYDLKSLKINEELKNKEGMALLYGNMSDLFAQQSYYAAAINYSRRALNIDEEIGNKRQEAYALWAIGNTYLSMACDSLNYATPGDVAYEPDNEKQLPIPKPKDERLNIAVTYLKRSLDSAIKINIPDVMLSANEELAKCYQITGNYRQALDAFRNFMIIKDSIYSKESEKQVLHTAMQYEYDKKHLADSLQSAQIEKIITLHLQRQRAFTYMGIAGVLLLLGFSYFITKERRKSDKLLLNILPAEVAEELKAKGNAEARYFDHVTVLFTDFVSFAKISERLSPADLVSELNACFSAFDKIIEKHNIEKIKTIGDAYLAVGGLPLANTRHAENTVMAAMEINAFMANRYSQLGERTFEIRIGIHSGSVVAGIVGVKKFAYDIWGDTVNTAARMEQNSKAGKINVSETTYELVKNQFHFEYRGEIDAKNKGEA